MLTSCKLTGSASDLAKYHTSEENYYFAQATGHGLLPPTGGGAAPNHVFVHGGLASDLGFAEGQAITADQLEHLLSGRDAQGKEVGRATKVMGIDLTFSAPKSVSIAGLLTVRHLGIIEAHDRAVRETMAEIERHAAGTRLYIDKQIQPVKTGRMVYVTVRDGFNRDHDPHLHTHVVVMNMTPAAGKIMTLDGRQIMRQDFNKLWGSMYRAKLASNLKELGHSVSYTKKGELRLDCVSLELEREFSMRRAQIEAAKAAGERDFAAWRKTRKEKNHEVNKAHVLADWQERLARHAEKTIEQNRQAVLSEREAWFREAKWSVEARQERAGERGDSEVARWQAAAVRATETCASVTPQVLVTEYLTELARGEGWQPISYAEAERRLTEQVRQGRIVATDDGRYTTWEMARVDRQCLERQPTRIGVELSAELATSLVKDYSEQQEYIERRGLSARQAAVAVGVLASRRSTVVVQGDAGAGKTTMLAAINYAASDQRWDTVGLAVQGVAARKLEEESGIKSRTLASYLSTEPSSRSYRTDASGRKPRLIIVDEASMLGSRDLAKLVKIADVHGDKVVLVGDQNQLQAIGAGRPFDRLVEVAQKSGELLSLSENFRQRDPELRKAVDMARGGRMRESLDQLNGMGCVFEIEGKDLRRLLVASEHGPSTLLITGSRESRDVINALVREDLIKQGLIDRSTAGVHSLVYRDADGAKVEVEREFAVGDVVAFQRNEYKEYDVRNGDRGRITKKMDHLLFVELEGGRRVKLNLDKYSDLDYGYAMTTYKSQGLTFDKVVIDADTSVPVLQDQRNTYVQITRARLGVKILTDDKAALRHQAGILNFKQDTLELKTTLKEAIARDEGIRKELMAERERLKELARDAAAAKSLAAASTAQDAAAKIARDMSRTGEMAPRLIGDHVDAGPGSRGSEIEEAARELKEAQAAEKAAAAALSAADKKYGQAATEWSEAQRQAEKANWWDKKSKQAIEKEASKKYGEASFVHGDARSEWGVANSRLNAAKEQMQERLREAEARSAEATRRSNFHGTLDTEAKAELAAREHQEAQRTLNEARAAKRQADRDFEAQRLKHDSLSQKHGYAQTDVWKAGQQLMNASLLGKAEARSVENAALRKMRGLEKGLSDATAARDKALKKFYEASKLVKQAEKNEVGAQARSDETTRINDVQATRTVLSARGDLTAEEQRRVSEYLGSAKAAKMLSLCNDPQEAIAIGCVNSGVKSLKEVTKDLSSEQTKAVEVSLKNQELENARAHQRERERSRGRDRGLSL